MTGKFHVSRITEYPDYLRTISGLKQNFFQDYPWFTLANPGFPSDYARLPPKDLKSLVIRSTDYRFDVNWITQVVTPSVLGLCGLARRPTCRPCCTPAAV